MIDMTLLTLDGIAPEIEKTAFIAPGARLIGAVRLGSDVSIWYNCVLRGDVNPIIVGARTNIQDGTIVHVTSRLNATEIGDDCLIGHMAIVHGCKLHNRSFVGLGSIVMDGCEIETTGMLAAGAMLTPDKRIGMGQMWAGRPARFVRDLSETEIARHDQTTAHYVELAHAHARAVAFAS